MSRLALLFTVLFTCAIGTAAPPATTQSDADRLAQHKQEQKRDYLLQLNQLPELKLKSKKLGEAFELKLENNFLVVHPKLPASNGPKRCELDGFNGPCELSVFAPRNIAPGSPTGVLFTFRDFSNETEIFRQTVLFSHAASVQLSMDLDGLIQSRNVSLIEDFRVEDTRRTVRLTGQLVDPATEQTIRQVSLSAPNFRALRRTYPREIQEFVVPILRDLQSEALLAPDAKIASQVLQPQGAHDAQLETQIAKSLQKLDSEHFQERDQAAADLDALGPAAAIILQRADRANWSISRASGVDAFLERCEILPPDEVRKLRDNPAFLVDCMYSEQPEIRSAAASALQEKSGLTIAANQTDIERDQLLGRVLDKLLPPNATQTAATQPAALPK